MSVIVNSDEFVELLKATKVTAYGGKDDPILVCAHLHSDVVDGDEGGEQTVLVATSSDGIVTGQVAIEAEGTLDEPILLDLASTSWLAGMIATAKKKMKQEAGNQAEFTVSLTVTGGEGGSGALVVQTLTDSAPGVFDTNANPPLADVSQFPLMTALGDLTGAVRSAITDIDGNDVVDGPAVAEESAEINVKKGIQAVFKEPVVRYPLGHSANRRLLTCGTKWRASVPGCEIPPHTDNTTPDLPVLGRGLLDSDDADTAGDED